jgi:hypothetical protein
MVQTPLVGESGFGVGGHPAPEDLTKGSSGASGGDKRCVNPRHRLGFAAQVVRQTAEVNEPRYGAHQAPAPPAQHEHGLVFEFLFGGQRVPKGKDALVGGNEIHDGLHAAAFRLVGQKPGDLIFGLAGTDGLHRAVHRLSTQAAQHPEALALFGGQIGTQAGQVAGKVGGPRVGPIAPSLTPRVSSATAS